jgi:hypothetical protein
VTLTVVPVNDAPVFTTTPETLIEVAPAPAAPQDRALRTLGSACETAAAAFTLESRATTKTEAGLYRVDDAAGRIGEMLPGDAGYTQAALAAGRARALFVNSAKAGAETTLDLDGGALYGFYLIVAPKRVATPGGAPVGPATYGTEVYFSFEGANPLAYDHLHAEVTGSEIRLAWENGTHAGDASFDDLIIRASGFVTGGGAWVYPAAATDVDGDTLTYSLVAAPDGTTVDSVTGRVDFAGAAGTYDVVLAVADGHGGRDEQAFQVTLAAPETAPRVTAVAAGPSGIRVRFDQALDFGTVNLYDDAAGSLGAADLVLLDGAGRPVSGSLIADADGAGLTFVATGGALAADTYSLTLRGAADAFATLDGDGDGQVGGDYTAAFTVATDTRTRVSIGDLVRGPGQSVDGTLAIRLDNATTGLRSVRFNLAYDPALLQLDAARLAAGLPAGARLSANLGTPGLARFVVTSTQPLPLGSLELVRLAGRVPEAAPYGAKQLLDLIDVYVQGSQVAADDDGIQVIAYPGDASANAAYSMLDASLIQAVADGAARAASRACATPTRRCSRTSTGTDRSRPRTRRSSRTRSLT